MKRLIFLLSLLFSPLASTVFAAEKAHYLVPPEVIIPHTAERSFIGPGMFVSENGDILMAAPWGRPPTNFEEVAAKFPVPMLYRSKDGGRTWKEQGRMRMEWNLTGLISDGGTSFLRLHDGRLAVVFNRHVRRLHGGGTPVIAFSSDDGNTWTAARTLLESDDAFYVMNDRLIQLRTGRLVLPVARKAGKTEGDRDEGLAMLSDDSGATWRLSRGKAIIEIPRGMAEPCVAELGDGRVLMLGRTGLGFVHAALSADGGETWSAPAGTTLESACSSLTLKTLPDGRLIVFYNHATPIKAGAFFPRTPLCYAVSGDGGNSWSAPVVVDDEGVADKDRQNIYPSICFTKEGMVVMWSIHGADPKGSFKGQYDPNIGGGKRAILAMPQPSAIPSTKPLRILPLGDSITRGSYLAKNDGQSTGLPHPMGGGWRKALQDKLRGAGVAYDFVGELQYAAFGQDGRIAPGFDPDHHGLAGFGNMGILKGGKVPTLPDVLASLGVPHIEVPRIVDVLHKHQPDVILMMTGANGFDAVARDQLIRSIGETSAAHLFVATILPQKAPRAGWEKVDEYNASLPAIVAAQRAAGKRITLVDMHGALTAEDLLPDGVHPGQEGMEKMAATWLSALQGELKKTKQP